MILKNQSDCRLRVRVGKKCPFAPTMHRHLKLILMETNQRADDDLGIRILKNPHSFYCTMRGNSHGNRPALRPGIMGYLVSGVAGPGTVGMMGLAATVETPEIKEF